jgi:capsular exopolysaccharide synthesis family protein
MSRVYDAMKRAAGKSDLPPATKDPDVPKSQTVEVRSTEEYQRLTQAIVGSADPMHVVLVVSSVKGEGVSTVARNVATMLSQNEKTLLLDANLRHPSQHLAFGVKQVPGLSDIARQKVVVDDAIQNGFAGGLSLIACGESTEGAIQLSTRPLKEAMDLLRSRFNRVIIDGPPITLFSEAVSLANLADSVILVVQADRTRWEVAEQAIRSLEESGARVLGAVLNRRKYHIPDTIYRRL